MEWILEDNKITKSRCFTMLQDANIKLPAMYRLGYNNNNCIGCVKGQMSYWNKIRVDFPLHFDKMARLERKLNVAICKSYAKDGKRKRIFLDSLDPNAGTRHKLPDIDCGVLCLNDTAMREEAEYALKEKLEI